MLKTIYRKICSIKNRRKIIIRKQSVVPDQEMIKTRKDAMMIAASIIYSGSGEFPYEVEFLGGTIETEVATISSIRIKRKITGKMQQIA